MDSLTTVAALSRSGLGFIPARSVSLLRMPRFRTYRTRSTPSGMGLPLFKIAPVSAMAFFSSRLGAGRMDGARTKIRSHSPPRRPSPTDSIGAQFGSGAEETARASIHDSARPRYGIAVKSAASVSLCFASSSTPSHMAYSGASFPIDTNMSKKSLAFSLRLGFPDSPVNSPSGM